MNWKDTRWLLLGIFVAGFVVCQTSLRNLGLGFLALTLLDAMACGILLSRLSGPVRDALWAWIMLVLFLDGYFIRMYWFAYHLNRPVYINRYYSELRWVTRARILAGYPWASAGFVIFCITAAAILTFGPHISGRAHPSRRSASLATWSQCVIGLALVYLLASLLQFRLGFGVRGVANPSLPLHLGTVVTFGRSQIIPGLLVLALWVFQGLSRRWSAITLWILFISGVISSLLSTSRGELLLFTGPVFVLWSVTAAFNSRRKWALLVVMLVALILVPIVSAYRSQRISGNAASVPHLVSADRIAQSAFFLGDRVGDGGVEAIWYALDHKGIPSVGRTLTYLHPSAFTRFYTTEVVGVRAQNDYRSSGMFGAFIIIGSSLALLLGTIVIVLLIWGLWTALGRLRCWPVALSLAAVTVTVIVSDPTGAVLTVPKLLIQVAACEFVYRRLTRPSGVTVSNGDKLNMDSIESSHLGVSSALAQRGRTTA